LGKAVAGTPPFAAHWLCLSPAYGPYLVAVNFAGQSPRLFWQAAVTTLAWAAVGICAAAVILNRNWRQEIILNAPPGWRGGWERWLHGSPAWRSALSINTITDITSDGSTARSAYIAAGYNLPGWQGDATTGGSAILSAWAGGALAPLLGAWGAMLCLANGHEQEATQTVHRFDLGAAKWLAPIGPPQIHRQVSPSYVTPPADADVWYDPDNHQGYPVLDISATVSAGMPVISAAHSGVFFTPSGMPLRYDR